MGNSTCYSCLSEVFDDISCQFVEGESIILPPLSQLHSTHISSLLEVPSSQDSVSVDNKLHALQKVLQQSGVEVLLFLDGTLQRSLASLTDC